MYAVLEEIERDMACLVSDTKQEPIYLPVTALPSQYEIGDVFLVSIKNGTVILIENDRAEKKKRLASNRSKRERLLQRSLEMNRKNRED